MTITRRLWRHFLQIQYSVDFGFLVENNSVGLILSDYLQIIFLKQVSHSNSIRRRIYHEQNLKNLSLQNFKKEFSFKSRWFVLHVFNFIASPHLCIRYEGHLFVAYSCVCEENLVLRLFLLPAFFVRSADV